MKKNKKIIITILITIILIAISITIYMFFLKGNKEYPYKNGPSFLCSNTLLYSNNQTYDKGDIVYCSFSYEGHAKEPGITEIWAEFEYDEDIEYLGVAKLYSDWELIQDKNKINLIPNEPVFVNDGAYIAKFKIKPSTNKEKLEIAFKNIKFQDETKEKYITNDSIITIKINKENNYKIDQPDDSSVIKFYKFDSTEGYKQINEYKCTSEECHPYVGQCVGYVDLDKGRTFLMDGEQIILYDFEKGIIGKYGMDVYSLNLSSKYESKYYVVRDLKTKKYGIIEPSGKVIKKFDADSYGTIQVCDISQKTYSVENDIITEKKGNKYGIVKITSNEIIVKHQFDDIRLENTKYFKGKIGDKWYLYDLNTKEKAINDGYQELFVVNDNIIIAQIDKKLYIKDYQGKNIIEDTIKVYEPYDENACCGAVSGVYIFEENNIVKIYIDELIDAKEYTYKQHKYEYNIANKKLTKID